MKDLKKLLVKFKTIAEFFRRYAVFTICMVVLLAYSFVVWRINVLISQEPSESAVNEKLQTVKRPAIDQKSVNTIQRLQDNNVQVQTLFQQARDNPFQE